MSTTDTIQLSEQAILDELNKNSDKAKELLENEDKLEQFLLKLEKKIKELPHGFDALAYVPIMGSLLNNYVKKKYRAVPYATLIYCVVALIYVVNPIDIIPDAVPALGYIDDTGVILASLPFIKKDLDDFVAWRDKAETAE